MKGQLAEPDSLLNLYKKLIAIRQTHPEFRNANNDSIQFLNVPENVYAFKRLGTQGEWSLVLLNGSASEATETVIAELEGKTFTNLLDDQPLTFDGGKVTLAPGACYILKAQ